jgi:hypothetical protein
MRGLISFLRFILSLVISAFWIYFIAIAFGFKDAALVQTATKWVDVPLDLLRPIVDGWAQNITIEPFKAWTFGVMLVPEPTGMLSVFLAYLGQDAVTKNFSIFSALDNIHLITFDLTVLAFIILLYIIRYILRLIQLSMSPRRGYA